MFWRSLGVFIDALWTDLMLELERNPLAVRQGAAAVACIAAAAIAMPVISHRAAEQREGAEWSARALSFESHLQAQLIPGYGEPGAEVRLVSLRTSASQASLVRAALRGPFEAPAIAAAPAADASALDQKQLRCLSEAIYYEARSESVRGQVAVGEVVMNRVHSRHYPRTICGVVYQGHERSTGCQFTFTCDGSLNRRPGGRAWARAQHIAAQVMQGHTRSVVASSTHYHTNAVSPRWRGTLVETMRLGDHVFYRLPTRRERAVLLQAAAQRAAIAQAAAPPRPQPPVAQPAQAQPGRVQGEIPGGDVPEAPTQVAQDVEPKAPALEPAPAPVTVEVAA